MKLRLIIITLLFSFSFSLVQAQLAMGKWRTHFAYNSVNQISQSDRKIFGISEGALFSVDKEDLSVEFYNKQNGLSDNNIVRIAYDNLSKQLLIIYKNGNIDLLHSGGITNIPDFYNKQLAISKEVFHVCFSENKAYLSCDFGIIVINIPKAEIADTYFIGANGADVKVLNVEIHNSYIYAISANTLYRGKLNEPNLVNFEYWTPVTNLPGSGEFTNIANFAGRLYLIRGGRIYVLNENNTWGSFMPELKINDFLVSNNRFILFNGSKIYSLNQTLELSSFQNTGSYPDATYDVAKDTYWFAGGESGIVSYKQAGVSQPIINTYKPFGPATNFPWNMTFSGSKLFVVQGGRWAAQYQRPGYVMMYEKENWTNLDPKLIKDITKQNVQDFMNVAVDPTDNSHFFVTSYGNGLFEFKNNSFSKWHNYLNSTIENIVPTAPFDYMRLDGAVFDKDGNLFMVNTGTASAIKVLMKDGKWEQLAYPDANQGTMGQLTISNQNPNQKWVQSVRNPTPGLLIFDDNGTITKQSDDKWVFKTAFQYIETENGQSKLVSISPSYIYTIVQDLNGVMWVGTDAGPFLFQNLSKVYDSDYTCSKVKIPRKDGTGQADYLLQNERIKSIAIDGANRKWLGTENSGVYLMSENGQQTIEQFTTENSPLLSNNVISIAIHPTTGEVFFGTGNGIVSYQSNAVDGEQEYSNVHAYPNPVREGYKGIITITGLVKDSQVKITDLNGNLICQTISNGGIATWDGKDVHGRKVSTGIYLAICAGSDGTQSSITKIMIIN